MCLRVFILTSFPQKDVLKRNGHGLPASPFSSWLSTLWELEHWRCDWLRAESKSRSATKLLTARWKVRKRHADQNTRRIKEQQPVAEGRWGHTGRGLVREPLPTDIHSDREALWGTCHVATLAWRPYTCIAPQLQCGQEGGCFTVIS